MMKHSNILCAARAVRRLPLFPIIPFVPIGLLLANAIGLALLFRRVRRLEAT